MFFLEKKFLRSCALVCLVVLSTLLVAWTSRGNVRAEGNYQPAYQDPDEYPYPGDQEYTPEPTYTDSLDDDYPFPSDETPVIETPEAELTEAELPSSGPTLTRTQTPAGAVTHTRAAQPPLQATLTEVTEGIIQSTPSSSRTVESNATQIVLTTTVTVSAEVTATGYRVLITPSPSTEPGGLRLDWGLFWIGFSVPVLAAGGGVLYLLDHQDGFFSKRNKK